MSVRERMERTATAVLTLCAVGMTLMVARREFWPRRTGGQAPNATTLVANWPTVASEGHRIGPESALVTLVEFADFQCPVCGTFARGALRGARARYGDSLAVVLRHWPLPYHPLAYPAARAAECAGAQGRYTEYSDALFAHQDSLGVKSFAAFAADAGVPDLKRFTACGSLSNKIADVERDTKAALALKGRGTPTVIINGEMLTGVPDSTQLDDLIRKAFARSRRG